LEQELELALQLVILDLGQEPVLAPDQELD
jgi:hypothetical protein